LDRIVISSEARPVDSVLLSGFVKRPGRYAITRGERLSSVLQRAGGFLPEAFPKGAVLTRESIRRIEQQDLQRFIRIQEQALLAESAGTAAGTIQLSSGERTEVASTQAAVTAQRLELLRSLAAAVTLGRIAVHVDKPENLIGTPDDISLEGGDSLSIPQYPATVLVIGAVRNSTAIRHAQNEPVDYYVEKAGGASAEADTTQMYILRADGSAVTGYVKVQKVEAGDTIVVPISTEPKIRALPFWKDIATIVAGFALPVATIWALVK
jgi:protein involved in polysaccharide export with SLBB domain